jgi:hypothetical protein
VTRKHISKSQRFRIFTRDHFMCRYCGARGNGVVLHVDHILAVIRGGNNEDQNLVTACQPCNAGKGAELLTVLPPWQPLPERPAFEWPTWGRELRVGGSHYQATQDANRSLGDAIQEVYRRVRHATRQEDDDGNELSPSDYLELSIWRPANNPHSYDEFEPHVSFIFDSERGESDIWADELEEDARKLFDDLPHHKGWTYWRGGHSPLPGYLSTHTDCEFLLRSGAIQDWPGHIDNPWQHIGPAGWDGRGDIIAYRISKTKARRRERQPRKSGLLSFDEFMEGAEA